MKVSNRRTRDRFAYCLLTSSCKLNRTAEIAHDSLVRHMWMKSASIHSHTTTTNNTLQHYLFQHIIKTLSSWTPQKLITINRSSKNYQETQVRKITRKKTTFPARHCVPTLKCLQRIQDTAKQASAAWLLIVQERRHQQNTGRWDFNLIPTNETSARYWSISQRIPPIMLWKS